MGRDPVTTEGYADTNGVRLWYEDRGDTSGRRLNVA